MKLARLRCSWFGWDEDYDYKLNHLSTLVELCGKTIEYYRVGTGIPVVQNHATPGGFDQGLIGSQLINESGCEVITWSRPGYLRTPLNSGATQFLQCELLEHLLDHLGIEKAVLLGISSGCHIAVEFARCYPSRTSCVILENPVFKVLNLGLSEQHLKKVTGIFFNTFENWLSNLFLDSPYISPKQNFKGQNFVDQELIENLLFGQFHDQTIVKTIVDYAKTIGPSQSREIGFRNDITEILCKPLSLENFTIPVLVSASDDVYRVSEKLINNKYPNVLGIDYKPLSVFVKITVAFSKLLCCYIKFS